MIEKKNASAAELREAAEYHTMTELEQQMFDKVLTAQWTIQKENQKKLDEVVDRDGMTKEDWEALTDEEKAAMKDKMGDMRKMMEGKQDDRMKSDMDMKNKADYFKGMN